VKPFIKSPASEIIDPVEFAVTYPRFALFPAVRPWHPYRAGDGFDCVRFLNAC
jgi:hypothetical protein